jgi:protein SCO1/2
MTNRRHILTKLITVPAVAVGLAGTEQQASAQGKAPCDCPRPRTGPFANYFRNVVVETHEGRKALFYDDLLRGKTVLINCSSVKNEAAHPVTDRLLKVQDLLGDRMGRDVFIYTITTDPGNDTPRELRAFAAKKEIKPGWLFLTGDPHILLGLRGRLFQQTGGHAAHHAGSGEDCSLGLIRYGNEAVGIWGAAPWTADPEWIVKRLSWIQVRKDPTGPATRGGPEKLVTT